MGKETIKFKNIVSIGALLLLLLAIPEGIWPYGYFVLLRWIVAGVALLVLWTAYNLERKRWVWLMAGIAILFNPVIPIHLDKATWQFIDLVTAGIFLVSVFKVRQNKKKVQEEQS